MAFIQDWGKTEQKARQSTGFTLEGHGGFQSDKEMLYPSPGLEFRKANQIQIPCAPVAFQMAPFSFPFPALCVLICKMELAKWQLKLKRISSVCCYYSKASSLCLNVIMECQSRNEFFLSQEKLRHSHSRFSIKHSIPKHTLFDLVLNRLAIRKAYLKTQNFTKLKPKLSYGSMLWDRLTQELVKKK